MSLTTNYSLTNKENYNFSLDFNIVDVMDKYNKLVFEYLLFIIENIGIKNSVYNKFIISRGLETITNVFSILLVYSKNLDMVYYHSQKSFYFYVEFIGQISENQHSFLQLSSRDASIFVYKKTIFEMPIEINVLEKTEMIEIIDVYRNIVNLLILKLINEVKFDISIEDNKTIISDGLEKINKITDKLKINAIQLETMNEVYESIING